MNIYIDEKIDNQSNKLYVFTYNVSYKSTSRKKLLQKKKKIYRKLHSHTYNM